MGSTPKISTIEGRHTTELSENESGAHGEQEAYRLALTDAVQGCMPQSAPESGQSETAHANRNDPAVKRSEGESRTARPSVPNTSKRGDDFWRPWANLPMTVKDAATFLGVSPQTVYLWVERKQIPHLRVMGRNIRFLRSDLEPFRAQFRQEVANAETA